MAEKYPNLAKSPLKLNMFSVNTDSNPRQMSDKELRLYLRRLQNLEYINPNTDHFPLSEEQAKDAEAVIIYYDRLAETDGRLMKTEDFELTDALVSGKSKDDDLRGSEDSLLQA